jgi:DNA-binding CsgD family transcriptional regulator
MGQAATIRSRERIEDMCASVDDARQLRSLMLDEIRHVVGFDAYAWLLTDPATSVGCAPLADVPSMEQLPRVIRLKYLTRLNRWTTLGDPPVALLSQGGAGESGSLLGQYVSTRFGVRDIASCVFRDRFGCWGFLDLWRSGGQHFDAVEAGFLIDIAGAVTRGLRRCQAETFAAPHGRGAIGGPGAVVLLLSPELDVRGQTADSDEYLRLLLPTAVNRAPVPANAYNVAAQVLANEAGVDPSPPMARVHVADGMWATLRAARIGQQPALDRDIAVSIEETSAADRADLFVRAFGLSSREAEVFDCLVAGCDTRQTASRLFLSEHTVQDHLKSVFAKTGAHSRRTLLTRALGR